MRVAVVLIFLTLMPLLAGCLKPHGEFNDKPDVGHAVIRSVAGRLNQQTTPDPAGRQANELSIAVNPNDASNIIATGKDYTQPFAGECVWDGIYASHDGGATWQDSNLLGSPWKRRADLAAGTATPPSQTEADLSKFYCATDPVVAFGPDGTAYWAVMPYQCDAATGSKTGAGQAPRGGLNDWAWSCSSMYVLASSDGGATWPTVSQVAFGPRLEDDKMWLSVDANNEVLLCWDRDAYVTSLLGEAFADGGVPNPGVPVPTVPDLPAQTGIVCSASIDHAKTWTQPAVAVGSPWALPWIDFSNGANGPVAWMAVIDGAHVAVLHTKEGAAFAQWSTPQIIGNYTDPTLRSQYGWPILNGSAFRIFATAFLAIDNSGGPNQGALYVTWMDTSTGTGRTLFAASHDNGATWSRPTWVHDLMPASDQPAGDQFMGAMSVGPDGTIDLSWLDRRWDPANHLYDLAYSYSTDGGAHFAPTIRVSTNSSDEQYSHHQNGVIFLGDYMDIDSSQGAAHPVWVDTRNHKADAFTATIERPGANP